MKFMIAFITLLYFGTVVWAQFPTPAPTAPPPPAVTQTTPPAPAPVVVTAAPTSPNADLFTAVWALLGFGVLSIIGYISPALKQALTAGGNAATAATTSVPHVAATVASVLADPAFKQQIEAVLSRVISSGVPGTVLTAGAGFVPGAGPIVALLEPMIRAAVLEAMSTHTTAITPVSNQLTDLLGVVNGLKAQIEAIALPKVAA